MLNFRKKLKNLNNHTSKRKTNSKLRSTLLSPSKKKKKIYNSLCHQRKSNNHNFYETWVNLYRFHGIHRAEFRHEWFNSMIRSPAHTSQNRVTFLIIDRHVEVLFHIPFPNFLYSSPRGGKAGFISAAERLISRFPSVFQGMATPIFPPTPVLLLLLREPPVWSRIKSGPLCRWAWIRIRTRDYLGRIMKWQR